MLATLQQLMRHESIETTLKYYVGRNAEMIAAALYEDIRGNTLGDSVAKLSSTDGSGQPEVDIITGFMR